MFEKVREEGNLLIAYRDSEEDFDYWYYSLMLMYKGKWYQIGGHQSLLKVSEAFDKYKCLMKTMSDQEFFNLFYAREH